MNNFDRLLILPDSQLLAKLDLIQKEIVTASLPCVITAQKGLNDPRYPSLKGIMGAKNKPIEELPAAAAIPRVEVVAMKKPAAKAAGKIVGTNASAVPELVRLLHEEAKVI